MTYIADWYIPQRLILSKLEANLNLAEIKSANRRLRELVAEGQDPVHCILDLSKLQKWPVDFRLFQEDYPFNETTGWVVLVGGNAMMRYVAELVTKLVGKQLHSCVTLDAAMIFLKQQDTSLTNLL